MAVANPSQPLVSLFFGLLVSEESLFPEVERILEKEYSSIVLRSPVVPFDQTDYYNVEMGPRILRRWIAVEWLIDQDALATIKNHTNRIEGIWAAPDDEKDLKDIRDAKDAKDARNVKDAKDSKDKEASLLRRRVNIDPGYLTPAKVVLASGKDRDHRVYLGAGVLGEVTLSYKRASRLYEPLPWTYPDYRTRTAQDFFLALREKHRHAS